MKIAIKKSVEALPNALFQTQIKSALVTRVLELAQEQQVQQPGVG